MSDSTKLALANAAGSIAVLGTLLLLYACVGSVDYSLATDAELEAAEPYVQAHRGLMLP